MEKELEVNNLKLNTGEQEKLRLKIIRVAKKNLKPNGKVNVMKVVEICECSESHVRKTWYKYQKGGINAIRAKKMGRPKNKGKLTLEMQKEIRRLIIDKYPDQLRLLGFLWDRKNIKDLVFMLYGIKIALQNISVYLKKWGMSSQRPIKRHYKQDQEKVDKWLNEEYPAIKKRAEEENAEIHWGDETGIQNECNFARGFAPIGKTPIIPVGNHRIKINKISTVTNQGKMRFMIYKDTMNAKTFIVFLQRLIKGASRKIFLIVDNLSVHHSKTVKEWIKKHIDKIEIFYLPAYSPEYNPDEYLNNTLKRELEKMGFSKTQEELEKKVRSILRKYQRDGEKIKSLFNAEYTKYAS